MFTKKEFTWIIIIIIIFEFILALGFDKQTGYLILDLNRPLKFLVPILIIFVSVIAKKIAAPYYSIKIEHSGWRIQRFGYYTRSYLKKPFPMGIVFPFFIAFFTLSFIKPLTFLQFDAENDKRRRIQRHHGDIKFRKDEMNESDLNLTAFWGFFSLICLSIIGIILNFRELALYPIYFSLWNLFPWENLDGLKILVANFFTWLFLVFLNIIVWAIALMFV